jgi:hypothetical protein
MFGMNNRVFGTYLAATHRILNPIMKPHEPVHALLFTLKQCRTPCCYSVAVPYFMLLLCHSAVLHAITLSQCRTSSHFRDGAFHLPTKTADGPSAHKACPARHPPVYPSACEGCLNVSAWGLLSVCLPACLSVPPTCSASVSATMCTWSLSSPIASTRLRNCSTLSASSSMP